MGWYKNYHISKNENDDRSILSAIENMPNCRVDAAENYIILYVDYKDFTYIDFILLNITEGIYQVFDSYLNNFHSDKDIIIEIEEIYDCCEEEVKREKYFISKGFKRAKSIENFRTMDNSTEFLPIEIYYFSEAGEDEIRNHVIEVYVQMKAD